MEIGTPDPPPQPTDTGCPPAHLEIKGEGAAHVLLSPHGRLAHHRPAEVGLGMGGGSGDRITEGGGTHDTGMVSWAEQAGSISGASLCPVPGTRGGRAHSRRNQI